MIEIKMQMYYNVAVVIRRFFGLRPQNDRRLSPGIKRRK